MNKFYLGSVLLMSVLIFANCGQNNNNNSSGGGAVTMAATCYLMETNSNGSVYTAPTPVPAPGTAVCNPASYAGYPGFTSITGSNSFGSFGGVSVGSSPSCGTGQDVVYSPNLGLGCASNTAILGNGQPVMYQLSAGSQALVTVSTFNPTQLQYQQQYGNSSAYGNVFGGAYSGYNGYGTAGQSLSQTTNGEVLRICSQMELCPTGQRCASPFGVGTTSSLGVCYY